MKDSLDRLLRHGAARTEVLALAGGLPADVQFPRRALVASFLRAIRAPETLQYGWPEGLRTLRQQVAQRLRARAFELDADDVLITSGAQQAIAIATQLVCRPGDRIAVARATYPAALDLFRSQGLVPVTDGDARVSYVMPAVANPGGRSLSADERRILLAEGSDFFIEDDAYADLSFAGPPGPPLATAAPGRAFYVGTLSKILCPGLRVGWLVAPRRFRKRAWRLKQASDLQAGGLSQAVVSDFLAHDDLDARAARLRRFYRGRAGHLLRALRQHAPFWRVEPPAGGFSLWVETDSELSEESFLSLALHEGVSFDPGSGFRADESESPLGFRLCFSALDPGSCGEAVRRLVVAWRRALANRASVGRTRPTAMDRTPAPPWAMVARRRPARRAP